MCTDLLKKTEPVAEEMLQGGNGGRCGFLVRDRRGSPQPAVLASTARKAHATIRLAATRSCATDLARRLAE